MYLIQACKEAERACQLISALQKTYDSMALEIGSGKGRFAVIMSAKERKRLFICIEIRKKFIESTIGRATTQKDEAENLLIIRGDAKFVVPALSRHGFLFERIYINFPDPWWKKRHQKRKLVSSKAVEDIIPLLKCGGEIFIQTDVFERAKQFISLLTEYPELVNLADDKGFYPVNPFNTTTTREEICKNYSMPVFRLYFRKSR